MAEEYVGRLNEISALGYVRVPLPILMDPRLSNSAKIAFAVLRRFSRSDGHCFPGVARIARGMGVSEREVRRLIVELCENGLVIKKQRPGTTNYYWLVDVEEVYGLPEDRRLLSDETIRFMREAGEEKAMDHIGSQREAYYAQFGDPEPTRDMVDSVSDRKAEGEDVIEDRGVVEPSAVKKWESAMNFVEGRRERSVTAAKRRKENKRVLREREPVPSKRPVADDLDRASQYTAKDLELEWRVLLRELWPTVTGVAPPWGVKQFSIVKGLFSRYMADGVKAERIFWAFLEVPRQWDHLASGYNLKGYPNVQLVAGYAETWFPQLWSGGIDTETDRERARKLRNWDDSRASDNEREGGITFL